MIQIHIMTNCADPDPLASSELIWIYTVCKVRVYPGSAGLGLNLNNSNTHGSFTWDDSLIFESLGNSSNNSGNKYLWKFYHFILKLYVLCTHQNCLIEAILMIRHNIPLFYRSKDFPKLSQFASWHGTILNPQWLKLPISQINFHGPKDVQAIEFFFCFFFVLTFVSQEKESALKQQNLQ